MNPAAVPGVELLEADLLAQGWLLSLGLRAKLTELDVTSLVQVGSQALADVRTLTGDSRAHTPLFRKFPNTPVESDSQHFVKRLIALLSTLDGAPCMLCGDADDVHSLSGCGHLVCGACFSPDDYSACAICGRSLDATDPYLTLGNQDPGDQRRRVSIDPKRLRVLDLGGPLREAASNELAGLLSRPTSLGGSDSEDLIPLLEAAEVTSWPTPIPGRATRARVAAWLIDGGHVDAAKAVLADPTDVLRCVNVLSGGGAELVDRVRLRSLPRPVRRTLMSVINDTDLSSAVEQMRSRPGAFKSLGSILHAGEFTNRYPIAATAFAALRGTRIPEGSVVHTTAASNPDLTWIDEKLQFTSTAGRLETALRTRDIDTSVKILKTDPGSFARRLNEVLHVAGPNDALNVVSAFNDIIAHVPAPLLLSVASAFAHQAAGHPFRVYFPKGGAARTHIDKDTRPRHATEVYLRIGSIVDAELLRRAEKLPAVGTALIDEGLLRINAPTGARTTSTSLVDIPRGSRVEVRGETIRLFVHWMENPGQRVDLDLSVIFLDSAGNYVDECSYTHLRAGDYATHSGDFTSAPAPKGASEFVDINISSALETGAVEALVCLYSYNSVPFSELAGAFAGWMELTGSDAREAAAFDARAVEQKFQLTGAHKSHIPLRVNLARKEVTWLDIAQGATGEAAAAFNATWNRGALGAKIAEAVASRFAVAANMFDVALAHAAGRALRVIVRYTDGTFSEHLRQRGEDSSEFATRIYTTTGTPIPASEVEADDAYVVNADPSWLAPTAAVYAVYPGKVTSTRCTLTPAADVVSALV